MLSETDVITTHHYTSLDPILNIWINRNTYICGLHSVDVPRPARASALLTYPNPPAYLPSSSLSKADPGCSSESLPVFTSSEKAGPTPAPGWVTGGTAEGSSGLGSAQILASKGIRVWKSAKRGPEVQANDEKRWRSRRKWNLPGMLDWSSLLPDQLPKRPNFLNDQMPHSIC